MGSDFKIWLTTVCQRLLHNRHVSGPLNSVFFFYIMLILTRLKPHSLKSHLCILHYYLLSFNFRAFCIELVSFCHTLPQHDFRNILALTSFYLKSRLTWQHISSGIQNSHKWTCVLPITWKALDRVCKAEEVSMWVHAAEYIRGYIRLEKLFCFHPVFLQANCCCVLRSLTDTA